MLDSSVALTWCFEAERTQATQAILDLVTEQGAHAPSLWPLEVVNVLVLAERRGQLTTAKRQNLITFLFGLQVALDDDTSRHAWNITAHLASKHRLTLYDATYLELAMRLHLPLATLDRELRQAATSENIALLGLG